MAKKSLISEGRPAAEVQDAALQPVQPVRAAASRLPQVRSLPDLPARARARGLHPRHDQVELVRRRTMLTDPIADMLTRIRNANRALHETTDDADLPPEGRDRPRPQGRGLHQGLPRRTRARAFDTLGGRAQVRAKPRAGHHRPAPHLEARTPRLRPEGPPPARPRRDGHGDHVHVPRPGDQPARRRSSASAAR